MNVGGLFDTCFTEMDSQSLKRRSLLICRFFASSIFALEKRSSTFSNSMAKNLAGCSNDEVIIPLPLSFFNIGYSCCLVIFRRLTMSRAFNGPFFSIRM